MATRKKSKAKPARCESCWNQTFIAVVAAVLAPEVPDIGGCIRHLDKQLVDDEMSVSLATCMADGESCEAVVGCALTEGVRRRR